MSHPEAENKGECFAPHFETRQITPDTSEQMRHATWTSDTTPAQLCQHQRRNKFITPGKPLTVVRRTPPLVICVNHEHPVHTTSGTRFGYAPRPRVPDTMQPRRHPFQTTSTKASRPNLITRGKPSTVVWRTPPMEICANHAGYPNTQLAGLALVTHRNQESKIRCNPAHTLQTTPAETSQPHTAQNNTQTRNYLPRLDGKQPVQHRNAPPSPTR